eukprot:4930606-Lingulodinium_polyedra.AAC.1
MDRLAPQRLTNRTRALHADACSHGARERAICEPLRRRAVDLTASLCSGLRTPRKDAAESTVRRRSGLQIAR